MKRSAGARRGSAPMRKLESWTVENEESRARFIEDTRRRMKALRAGGMRSALAAQIKLLESAMPGRKSESTTTWRPRVDVEIDPSAFEFTPPAG